MAFEDQKPEIEYPAPWGYRIVGASEAEIHALVRLIAAELEHEIHASRPSSKGTYVSVPITVTVRDEAHRDEVYRQLSEHDAVKIVL